MSSARRGTVDGCTSRRGKTTEQPVAPGVKDRVVFTWDSSDEPDYQREGLNGCPSPRGMPTVMNVTIRATFPDGQLPGQGSNGSIHDTIEAAFATVNFGVKGPDGQRNSADTFQVDMSPGHTISVPADWLDVRVSNPNDDPGLADASVVVAFSAVAVLAQMPNAGSATASARKTVLVPGSQNGTSVILPIPRYAKNAKLVIANGTTATFQLALLANSQGQVIQTSFAPANRPVNMDSASMTIPQGALFFQVINTAGAFVSGAVRVVFDLALG